MNTSSGVNEATSRGMLKGVAVKEKEKLKEGDMEDKEGAGAVQPVSGDTSTEVQVVQQLGQENTQL